MLPIITGTIIYDSIIYNPKLNPNDNTEHSGHIVICSTYSQNYSTYNYKSTVRSPTYNYKRIDHMYCFILLYILQYLFYFMFYFTLLIILYILYYISLSLYLFYSTFLLFFIIISNRLRFRYIFFTDSFANLPALEKIILRKHSDIKN